MATEKTMKNAGRAADIRAFASAVKQALERMYPSASVEIHEVRKNNNRMLTGIVILGKGRNIAPTIYLEDFFESYQAGMPLDEICRTIKEIHQEADPAENFDVSGVTDFAAVKGKICYKLVNAAKNAAMLQDIPHRLWQDLAVVYYVLLSKESAEGVSNLAVTNGMAGLWDVDEPALYDIARQNTPALLKAEVTPISEVINSIMKEMQECGQIVRPMDVEKLEHTPPLYVATNDCKFHGAAVLLYDGVLEGFAEQTGGDFYILPSSVHETLFMPVQPNADERGLPEIVRGINAEQVAPEDVLSDNVYLYCAEDHSVRLII